MTRLAVRMTPHDPRDGRRRASRWSPTTPRSTTSSSRSRARREPRILLPADRERRPERADRALPRDVRRPRRASRAPVAVPPRQEPASTCASSSSPRTSSTSAAARCATCSRSGASTGSTRSCARRGSAGVVLAGLSAGAMCWFEDGITTSSGRPAPGRRARPAAGLAVACTRRRARSRRPVFLDAVARGDAPRRLRRRRRRRPAVPRPRRWRAPCRRGRARAARRGRARARSVEPASSTTSGCAPGDEPATAVRGHRARGACGQHDLEREELGRGA